MSLFEVVGVVVVAIGMMIWLAMITGFLTVKVSLTVDRE